MESRLNRRRLFGLVAAAPLLPLVAPESAKAAAEEAKRMVLALPPSATMLVGSDGRMNDEWQAFFDNLVARAGAARG